MYLDSSRNIVARNAHLLYESSNNCYLEFKRFNTNRKILSQGMFMWNMKTLALTVEKLLTVKLHVFKK